MNPEDLQETEYAVTWVDPVDTFVPDSELSEDEFEEIVTQQWWSVRPREGPRLVDIPDGDEWVEVLINPKIAS